MYSEDPAAMDTHQARLPRTGNRLASTILTNSKASLGGPETWQPPGKRTYFGGPAHRDALRIPRNNTRKSRAFSAWPADLAQGPMKETKREEKREREGENVDFICLLVTVLIN